MPKARVDKNKCKGCFLCISFCPKGALKKSDKLNTRGFNFVEFIDGQGCIGCKQCVYICPDACIEVHR